MARKRLEKDAERQQETSTDKQWQSTKQAAAQLGISTDTLKRWAKDKILTGQHYRNISVGKLRPTYQWNVVAIQQFFENIILD